MTMKYNKADIPKVNPTYSSVNASKGRVICTVDGEIKVISCSPAALNKLLSCIDGVKTFEQAEAELQMMYPLEGIINYFEVLLSEDVLQIHRTTSYVRKEISVLLIGKGRLNRAVEKRIIELSKIKLYKSNDCDEAFDAIKNFGYDLVCIAPEKETYGQLFKLNKVLVDKQTPFLLFYYNGKELITGPFIIPGKTACYECQITHRINTVNEKLNKSLQIGTNNLETLFATQPIPDIFTDRQIDYLAEMICKDISGFMDKSDKYDLFESEKHFLPNSSKPISDNVYYATTECDCCHGMNSHYIKWENVIKPRTDDRSNTEEASIQYYVGGFRTLTDEQTQNFVSNAFGKAGLDISVERMINSPFNNVLPIFRASLKSKHDNNTPYHFRNTMTHGKGMTETQSFLSASFELAEHISSHYLGDVPIICATYDQAKEVTIDMKSIADSIYNLNTTFDTFETDVPVDWVWGRSLLDDEYRLVPASMVFMGDVKLRGHYYSASSTGLAAGATIDDAILQGMFEVIEHDAWLIGQSNKIPLPFIDYTSSTNRKLKESINSVISLGYRVIFRDYTNDLGFPVFRCWIVNPKNYTHYATSGFGSSLSAEIALERSFTEAIQSADILVNSTKTYFGRASAKHLITSANSFYSLSYFQEKDILGDAKTNTLDIYEQYNFSTVKGAIRETTKRLSKCIQGCDILFVDLTKTGLDIPVVRVLITGNIQHLNLPIISISPRMYEFPLHMGYSNEPSTLENLYLGPYPH